MATQSASTSGGTWTTGWRLCSVIGASVVLLAGLAVGITSVLQRSPGAPIGSAVRPTPAPSGASTVKPAVIAPAKDHAASAPVHVATGGAARRLLVARPVPSRGTSPAPSRVIPISRPNPPASTRRAPSPPPARGPSPTVPRVPTLPAAPAAPAPVTAGPAPPSATSSPPPSVTDTPTATVTEVADPDADEGHHDDEHSCPQHGRHDHGHHRDQDCDGPRERD